MTAPADDGARLGRVQAEFARQAETFDAYADKADLAVEDRFRGALGPFGAGRILDVACGPGAVTAAVARGAAHATGIDATPEMLAKAERRCREAGLSNVGFRPGDAENLPFEDGAFDAVVTRLSLHHFADPGRALGQMRRVLRPGGRLVVMDVIADDDPDRAALHNAIEILRDPSHVRMLPAGELSDLVRAAGFGVVRVATWEKTRAFDEWMGIVNDPTRIEPLRTVVRALAESGRDAGIGLRVDDAGRIVFFHRWRMVVADRS